MTRHWQCVDRLLRQVPQEECRCPLSCAVEPRVTMHVASFHRSPSCRSRLLDPEPPVVASALKLLITYFFRAVGNRAGGLAKAITADAIYKIVRGYSAKLGFEIGAHALRATAATNALDHQADIAKVQEWLGHANIATTRIYDHRKTRAEDSPTFKVAY